MSEKKKRRETEAEREPGFFSDHGYGNGTAITILHDPAKSAKNAKSGSAAKSKKNGRK